MKSKVLCYIAHAEVVDEDDDGNIVDRVQTQTVEIYGRESLDRYFEDVAKFVDDRTEALNAAAELSAADKKKGGK